MWTIPPEYLGPYLASNAIAVALVLLAWRWPVVARFAFALMFLAASIANTTVVLKDPESYVEYGDFAVLGIYKGFINGFFANHTIPIVLTIAFGQLCIAVLLALGGKFLKMGALGAGIFFLGIAPLGIGGAFPSMLLGIVALVIMVRRTEAATPESTRP